MSQLYRFDTVSEYNDFNNHDTLHPLVSVIDFSKAEMRTGKKMYFGLYCIILKDIACGNLKYGRHYYDYQEGTLVFISPGQVIDVQDKTEPYQPMGHGLVFHPDLIHGTSLARIQTEYSFFSYDTNEALHLSERERQIVLDCFSKIEFELKQSIDKHSKKLIASNIELFLNYCERFYDRQFITRENANRGILEQFEELLNDYFVSDKPQTNGLPSVAYFAEECNLSANYFGDLIKKETGKSAQEHIQLKLINIAKERIFEPNKSISQIAYELGFSYPQHFSRMFKEHVGSSPSEYRQEN
ncbi:helix-turn-helix transcriptional regulator [Aliifodinibius sp. S!AR15-10]|uniref:helix-turn-helix domain-containing protein n=1 Tax=Aliifodinibius sp. S!AR15-10 TaxID=2950437 RepID=UPI0028574103|nr:helix-turn-helix transcriptional regulator [Aliifodinibius sp. S!AR15-10]MDR8392660.1 helix-turn-helix transcriptional regulator [Aliifodinibius sp. S!AR15-10]